MKKEKSIQETAFNLEETTTKLGSKVDTLEDIKNKFLMVVTEMNEAVYRGDQHFFYEQHHRDLRILSELMYHTVDGLMESYDKLFVFSTENSGEALKENSNVEGDGK